MRSGSSLSRSRGPPEGEPDENGEEDCVEMYATGQWNDDSCYKRRQFFFVEYDA